MNSNVFLLLSGLSLGCQNYTRNALGVWTFTDNDMKLVIGQEIQSLACLAAIRIGEARFVGVSRIHYDYLLTISIGLATNFLLIESLQRFYQYYGDDLQVSFDSLQRLPVITGTILGRMSYGKRRLYESCFCRGRNSASHHSHFWS